MSRMLAKIEGLTLLALILVAVAAGIAVVILLGRLSPGMQPSPTSSPSPTTTPPSSPTTTPSPSPSPTPTLTTTTTPSPTTTETTTSPQTTPATSPTTSQPTYPEFPWLDQLKSMTSERGVTLIVLTRHEQSIQTETRKLFLDSPVAKELGITNIQFIYAPAEEWVNYIINAEKIGKPIDVAWGGGPTLFNNLDDSGFLLPIDSSKPVFQAIMYELNKIPARIGGMETYKVDRNGMIHWIGASVSSFGFTVNTLRLTQYQLPMPEKWEDLARPEYARYLPDIPLVSTADPTMSTSNTRIFEIILQAKGWDEGWRILTLLAANAIIYQSSSDARDAVIRGDVAVGTTIDFYGYMAQQVNPDCKYIAPKNETIINSDPIAIVNTTRHLVHAIAFVAWVLNENGGQQVWLNKDINRLPVNPKTFETKQGAERSDLKKALEEAIGFQGIIFNETLSAEWVNAIVYYFKATLVNPHRDLQAVWAKIANAYLENKISREWFDYLTRYISKPLEFTDPVTNSKVTFTVEYAIFINNYLNDQRIYQSLMTQWENLARDRYLKALDLLNNAISGQPVPSS
ncbi:MAG: ABC transporter substrate-binding protein [Desulfurococcus sp.]|nr:ABC transporter substrate-binding protein [Desulfurococcus sp.]